MRPRRFPRVFALALVAFAASAWLSCAPGGFRDEALVQQVRILAGAGDPPYVKPGQPVSVNVLAYDGRPANPQNEPMQLYWVPALCTDPPGDAYYACFAQFAQAARGDAGAGAGVDGGVEGGMGGSSGTGLGGLLQPGKAIPLPTGTCDAGTCSYTLPETMPSDAVTGHTTVAGTRVPYGMGIVFNIACAGHIEALPLDPTSDNPVQIPLGCFDTNGNQLSPDNYVIGYVRVYAFDTVTNANPVIDHVDLNGQAVDLAQGFTVGHCSGSGSCPTLKIGPVVPASSQEPNPEQIDSKGNVLKEEIWADFYSTFGSFSSAARLLYDPRTGSVGGPDKSNNEFSPPSTPGDGSVFIVVHDDRGGASWAVVPVHVN
jgi:hypothetical protein